MKDYDRNKESLYIQYWEVNNLYGWSKLPVNNFKLVKDIFMFDDSFIKSNTEESDKGYFLEVEV